MKYLLLILFLLISQAAFSQPTFGLVAHYTFDNDADTIVIDKTGNLSNNGLSNALQRDCGVSGLSVRMDGVNDQIAFSGLAVTELFGTEDFSLSFYFKPLNSNLANVQTILHKRLDCSNDNAFAIRYAPSTRNLNLIVSQNTTLSTNLSYQLDDTHCWHHVAVVRRGTIIWLYVDGLPVDSDTKPSRINITNDTLPLFVGQSSCLTLDDFYEGFFDELLLYNRALTDEEVKEIYLRPDHIGNAFVDIDLPKDTIVFLGNSLETYITGTCVDEFQWTPATGVSDPGSPQTTIAPEQTTTYFLSFTDMFGCTAVDSLRISVIDPALLECTAYLPRAFTPNGDGRNETFGVDNPFALTDFVSLEIFDRWGGRVFFTDNAFMRWQGDFQGQPVNPGVFLYKIRYKCQGTEKVDSGSLTVIR